MSQKRKIILKSHLVRKKIQSNLISSIKPRLVRGFLFQWNLFWIRNRRNIPYLAILIILLAAGTYIYDYFPKLVELFTTLFPVLAKIPESVGWAPKMMGGMGYFGALFFFLSKYLRNVFISFLTKPGDFTPLFSKALQGEKNSHTGFRTRFAKEIGEVTRALGSNQLVIFIDDLDRCQASKIVEVLETVNFMVSCCDCYFIMGIDKVQIQKGIELGYGELARKWEGGSARFAEDYLEKIVNIEIQVPVPNPNQVRSFLTSNKNQPIQGATKLNEAVQMLKRNTPVWVMIALFIWTVFYFGNTLAPSPANRAHKSVATGGASTSSNNMDSVSNPAQTAGTKKPGSMVENNKTPNETTMPGLFNIFPAITEDNANIFLAPNVRRGFTWAIWSIAGCVGLFILWVGLNRLNTKNKRIVEDSQQFKETLITWSELIYQSANTPRSLKRFLNRMRYMALLNKELNPDDSQMDDTDIVDICSAELAVREITKSNELNTISLEQLVGKMKAEISPHLNDRIQGLMQKDKQLSEKMSELRELGEGFSN